MPISLGNARKNRVLKAQRMDGQLNVCRDNSLVKELLLVQEIDVVL